MLEIEPSIDLADLFSLHRNNPWYFLASGGNWGDSLIYAGAEKLARTVGLRWSDVDSRAIENYSIPRGACVYIHGGGGLNPWCSGRAFSNLKKACQVADAVVIQGPQTCDSSSEQTRESLVAALEGAVCKELHFFAREMTSAAFLARSLPSWVHLYVDHDTAFNLSEADILRIARVQAMPRGSYDLVVIREDNEQPLAIPNGLKSSGIALDPAYVARSFEHWVRIHLYARSITTNRLHSAIAGVLCAKPVTLGPSSSHKNESIWRYSLTNRGVHWVDGIDSPGGWWNALPIRVRSSYKFRQLRLALHGVPVR